MSSASASVPGLPPGVMFPGALAARLEAERIVAVITVERADDAVPLARALVQGGVRAIELAWRTADTPAALAAIKRDVPEMLLGVGTLLTPEQVKWTRDAGADFGVSPGLSAAVLAEAKRRALPYAPGVQTPSDVQAAIENGCRWLKFFPAESAGGLVHLRSLHAPFAHLGLRYIALGGITEANARAYFDEPIIGAVGGSWLAPAALVRARAWDEITQRAIAARALATKNSKTAAA